MKFKILGKIEQIDISGLDNYNEERQLMHRLEEHARIEGLRQEYIEIKIPESIRNLIDNKAEDEQVLKKDGSVELTDDWDIGDGRRIIIDEIKARDADGLGLYNDSGFGIFIGADNKVGVGTKDPFAKLAIDGGLHVGGDSDPGNDNLLVDNNVYIKNLLSLYDDSGTLTNAVEIENISPDSYGGSIIRFRPYNSNKYSAMIFYGMGTANTKQQASISVGSGVDGGDGISVLDQITISAEYDIVTGTKNFAIYNQAYPSGTIPFRNIIIGQRNTSSSPLNKFSEWDTLGNLTQYKNLTVNQNTTILGTLDWSSNSAKPKIYIQSSEPDLENDTYAFWKDTNTSKYYLLLDVSGEQKKVELI